MPHDRMLATRHTWTWINKYIFPGGFLPSVQAIEDVTRQDTTLRVTDRLSFGQHYAETLRRWDTTFQAARDEVRALGFDETFERMWHFYLDYSRAGFASGYIDVQQLDARQGVLMTTTEQRPAAGSVAPAGVAHRLEAALRPFVGGDLPVRLRAWDGSETGPIDAPLVELRSQDAVRRLLWHPGELGAAQAYVTGDIEVHHDLDDALTHVWAVAQERGLSGVRPSPGAFVRALRAAVDVGAFGKAPQLPDSQARVRGRLHSKLRDRRAISHHYDLSNEFYSLILDPSMAYSSGYWRSDSPSYGVADAQRDKLDLVCQKIGLQPGMRFLDIGCGWGSLSLHAARALRRSGDGRDHRGRAEEVHRRADPRARARAPGRDPAPGLPRDPRGPGLERSTLRRCRLDRDGRARRGAELRHLRTGPARRGEARRARPDPADVPFGRARGPPRWRAVHRVLHRPRHAHATDRRDGGVPRARRAGGTRRTRPARALRAHRRRLDGELRGATSPGSPSSWARRSCGSGGCTSSAARWLSATGGWVSTRS